MRARANPGIEKMAELKVTLPDRVARDARAAAAVLRLAKTPTNQSAFAPLSLTSFDHLTRSARRKLRNSSGLLPTGSAPSA